MIFVEIHAFKTLNVVVSNAVFIGSVSYNAAVGNIVM